jgi:hypothetical protein
MYLQAWRCAPRRQETLITSAAATAAATLYWKKNSLRKFPLNLIINLDETLLPFEFLNGYSYDFKEMHTVAGKSERSG